MSKTALDARTRSRLACQSCRERKARFRFRGHVRSDRDHTLCFECFGSERERQRARLLAGVARPERPSVAVGVAVVSDRGVAHRRAMLTHLSDVSARRSVRP